LKVTCPEQSAPNNRCKWGSFLGCRYAAPPQIAVGIGSGFAGFYGAFTVDWPLPGGAFYRSANTGQ
ncbi:MAG: hypothetical protein LLG42_11415, partial [Chloroflexi bacterium]|nr:hypothetical protein [Chloroflexota bacterium]